MVSFGELPEDCISNIISRSSPRDACKASSISLGFKSAADSDATWEQFFPSDYPQILSGSVAPLVFSTKKELYLHLSQSNLLLDGGKMSFSLGKESGKKCYMIGARQLAIDSGEDSQFWNWTSSPDSRFSEVAEILNHRRVRIRGKIQARLLSQKTTYVIYFVFKFSKRITYGRESADTSTQRENVESKEDNTAACEMFFCGPAYRSFHALGRKRRKDGWIETEMGQFFNDFGDDEQVEPRLTGIVFEDSGFIVEGFELRPKDDVK